MPRIRVVADYGSPGYQLLDETARADGEPRISEALRDRLIAWVERYEAECQPPAYEDVCGMKFDFITFAAEGQAIARAMKRELPGWTVTYWDESVDWYLARDPRSHDPARAEYEITIKDALTTD